MTSRYLFLIIFIVSCSHNKHAKFLTNRTNVSDKKEARYILENKKQYLEMIFQQSKDPYYGKLRWSEKCLKENEIGSLEETSEYLQVSSSLFLNQYLSPGFCSDSPDSKRYRNLVIYCPTKKEVREYQIPADENLQKISNYCY